MAKARTAPAQARAKAAAATPEPAVMGAGADIGNKVEQKGNPPAEAPTSADKEASAELAARGGSEEGFRNDAGQFTGNPPTDAERLDAICDLLEKNGWSLPKVLQRAKE